MMQYTQLRPTRPLRRSLPRLSTTSGQPQGDHRGEPGGLVHRGEPPNQRGLEGVLGQGQEAVRGAGREGQGSRGQGQGRR